MFCFSHFRLFIFCSVQRDQMKAKVREKLDRKRELIEQEVEAIEAEERRKARHRRHKGGGGGSHRRHRGHRSPRDQSPITQKTT